MSISPREYLGHIQEETQYLLRMTEDLSRESFLRDETLQRAFVRSLQIISAAASELSGEFRDQHPHVEWRKLIAINERLIHPVFGTDVELVWDVVSRSIPGLAAELESISANRGD